MNQEMKLDIFDKLIDCSNNWTKIINVIARIKRFAKKMKMGHRQRTLLRKKSTNVTIYI
jgi:hypothetical protein